MSDVTNNSEASDKLLGGVEILFFNKKTAIVKEKLVDEDRYNTLISLFACYYSFTVGAISTEQGSEKVVEKMINEIYRRLNKVFLDDWNKDVSVLDKGSKIVDYYAGEPVCHIPIHLLLFDSRIRHVDAKWDLRVLEDFKCQYEYYQRQSILFLLQYLVNVLPLKWLSFLKDIILNMNVYYRNKGHYNTPEDVCDAPIYGYKAAREMDEEWQKFIRSTKKD